jgi:predicted transcriptional regulator
MPQPDRPTRRFAPRKTGDSTPLGQLESAVMEVVWACSRAVQVGDVQTGLPADARGAYATVKTTMERLAEKGILSRIKHGKAYHYQAAVTREELERRIVVNALDRLVEQFPAAVASFFVQPDPGVSQEKLALLLEAVERKREAHDA